MIKLTNKTSTEKWRGIKTTQIPKHEDKPITIINRLGQKSIKLPRIDDGKRWAGFPGLAGTARKIAAMVPQCSSFVEAFAGTAKVFQELPPSRYNQAILNDTSPFITKWLKKEFPNANVTSLDFTQCIHFYDSPSTFFLIDPPWYRSYYDQKFSSFNRKTPKEYYEELVDICGKLHGKFIITSRKENKVMLNSPFKNTHVRSEYVVSGKYPDVLITTNLPLRQRRKS
jgi:site-specific DNA-adenine methylase